LRSVFKAIRSLFSQFYVLLQTEQIPSNKTVVCTGAWISQLEALTSRVHRAKKINPIKGQIACFEHKPAPCSRLLTAGHRYIVPRPDGILLVGSTSEKVGYDTVTTSEGQESLKAFAATLLPALKDQEPIQGWADVRPGLNGQHPIMGPVSGVENLFMAAGHYRNGICLAPITGEIMASYVAGAEGPLDAARWLPE